MSTYDNFDDTVGIVIDISNNIRSGSAGNDKPKKITSSKVGKSKFYYSSNNSIFFAGEEAEAKKDILKMKNPIKKGFITNFDVLEQLLDYILIDELKISPENHPFLFSEVLKNPKKLRERFTSMMFESFEVRGLYLSPQPLLSLYASGRTTGTICSSRFDSSSTVTCWEGYIDPQTIFVQKFGIDDVHLDLQNKLSKKGYHPSNKIVQNIVKKHCYVAIDYQKELKKQKKEIMKEYILPDGTKIELEEELFQTPELICNPFIVGSEYDGLDYSIHKSIKKAAIDLRTDLLDNIVLVGENTNTKGLEERIEKEIKKLSSKNSCNIQRHIDGDNAFWVGGSILSSLSTFQNCVIKKSDFQEIGASVITRKCPVII